MGHPRSGQKAFTLLEVMVGIGLAGALVLMILLLATTALSSDTKASDTQIASAVAEAELDLLTRKLSIAESAARTAFWTAPDGPYSGAGVNPTLVSNGTTFNLSYELEILAGPSGDIVGGPGNRMRQVRLTVGWWDGEEGKPGYGQLTITRIRVVRESDVRS